MSDEWLDPEEFPFTEDEVFQAATLWRNDSEARHFARELADLERKTAIQRTAHRAQMAARPADPDRIVLIVKRPEDPDSKWLWPALSVLSESCAARVRDGMSRRWESRKQHLELEAQVIELKSLKPVAEVVRLTRAGGNQEEIRSLVKQLRHDGIGLKEPTEEMRRAASETIELEKAAWLALAAESQRRLDARRTPTGSPSPTPPRP